MKIFSFENNKTNEVTFENISKKGITWIRLVKPTTEELNQVSELTKIPLEELQESIEEDERPRLYTKGYLELIYSAPHDFKEEGLQTQELYIYVRNNQIVTIEQERSKLFEFFQRRCSAKKAKFFMKSQASFLYHVIDKINDEFLAIIDRIAANIETVKKRDLSKVDLTSLYSTNITSAYFNQAILANLEALNQLKKSHFKLFTPQDRTIFNELYLDKLQILDTEKVQRELIMNMIDIQSIMSTERLNETMKRLAAFALIIAVPTLISSIYGMNIKLPLEDNPYAFYILTGVMISLTSAILIAMKKLDWI